MAWTDVKIELDKVKTAVDSLSTADGLTAKVDTLERVDAAVIATDCEALIDKLEDLKRRTEKEQELSEYESNSLLLRVIRTEKDLKHVRVTNSNGMTTSETFSSVTLAKSVTRIRKYSATITNSVESVTLKMEEI